MLFRSSVFGPVENDRGGITNRPVLFHEADILLNSGSGYISVQHPRTFFSQELQGGEFLSFVTQAIIDDAVTDDGRFIFWHRRLLDQR